MMTLQETFNKAYLAVVRQGCASAKGSGDDRSCLYRSSGGRACAVGQLIDDAFIDHLVEVNPACPVSMSSDLNDNEKQLVSALRASGVPVDEPKTLQVLKHLQHAHDCARIPETFIQDFAASASRIALAFGLSVPAE